MQIACPPGLTRDRYFHVMTRKDLDPYNSHGYADSPATRFLRGLCLDHVIAYFLLYIAFIW